MRELTIGDKYRLEDIGINPAAAVDRLYDMKSRIRDEMKAASRDLSSDEMGAGSRSSLKRDVDDLAVRILH